MMFAKKLRRVYKSIVREVLNNNNNNLSNILLIPFNNRELNIKDVDQMFNYLYTRECFANDIFLYESEVYNLMYYMCVFINNKNENKFKKFGKVIFSDIDFFIKFYECIKRVKVNIKEFDSIHFNCLRSLASFFLNENLDNISEKDIYEILQSYKNNLDEVKTYIELSIYSSFPVFLCTDDNIIEKFINESSNLCETEYGSGISSIMQYMLNKGVSIKDFVNLYKNSVKELVSLEVVDNESTSYSCESLFQFSLYVYLTSKIASEMNVNIDCNEIFDIIKNNKMAFLDNLVIKIGHKVLFNKKAYELFVDCLININNNTNRFLEKIFIYDLNVYRKFCDVIFNDIFLYVINVKNKDLKKLYKETNLFEEFISLISKYKNIPSFVFITLFCLECGYVDLFDLDDRRSKVSELELQSLRIWEIYYNKPDLICKIIDNSMFDKMFFKLSIGLNKDNYRLSIYDYIIFSNILRKGSDPNIYKYIKVSINEFYCCVFKYFGVFMLFVLVPYLVSLSNKDIDVVNTVFSNIKKYIICSKIYVSRHNTHGMYSLISRELDLSLDSFLFIIKRQNIKMFLKILVFNDIILCLKERLFVDKNIALFVEKFIRELKKYKKIYKFGIFGSIDEIKENKVNESVNLFFNLSSLV